MIWGTFGIAHILSLIIGAGLLVGFYFLLKEKSEKAKIIILGILSFSGIAAIIFNLVAWGSPYEYLPLHLCSLNALVLPIAVFKRSNVLSNLLLLWSLGALMALVVNTAQAEFVIFSPTFCVYYFPHLLEFGIPILMFKLGLVKKEARYIGSTIGITLGVYTLIHFINVYLNKYFIDEQITNASGEIIKVNYMYSVRPEIPLLELFWSFVPCEYWYMLPVLLVIVIYLFLLYIKQLLPLVKHLGGDVYGKNQKAE